MASDALPDHVQQCVLLTVTSESHGARAFDRYCDADALLAHSHPLEGCMHR